MLFVQIGMLNKYHSCKHSCLLTFAWNLSIYESIYEIRCSCGKIYNDKTGKNVSTRFEEHERWSGLSYIHSAIAEHQKNTGHKILFHLEIIGVKTRGHFLWKYRESIEIFKKPDMHINSWQRWRLLTLFLLF